MKILLDTHVLLWIAYLRPAVCPHSFLACMLLLGATPAT
jgi:hypothetical protein